MRNIWKRALHQSFGHHIHLYKTGKNSSTFKDISQRGMFFVLTIFFYNAPSEMKGVLLLDTLCLIFRPLNQYHSQVLLSKVFVFVFIIYSYIMTFRRNRVGWGIWHALQKNLNCNLRLFSFLVPGGYLNLKLPSSWSHTVFDLQNSS
jgi:hypothetical protein